MVHFSGTHFTDCFGSFLIPQSLKWRIQVSRYVRAAVSPEGFHFTTTQKLRKHILYPEFDNCIKAVHLKLSANRQNVLRFNSWYWDLIIIIMFSDNRVSSTLLLTIQDVWLKQQQQSRSVQILSFDITCCMPFISVCSFYIERYFQLFIKCLSSLRERFKTSVN